MRTLDRMAIAVSLLAGVGLLAARLASADDEVWGKRVWDRRVDASHRIVVDERGEKSFWASEPDKVVLRGLTYYWRLLEDGHDDGPILFTCFAVTPGSGTGDSSDPIDVLSAELIGGDLVTVFNQRGACWAYVAHPKADGTPEQRPTYTTMDQSDLDAPMKVGRVTRRPDGVFHLTVTDQKGQPHEFELRRLPIEENPYHWVAVKPPATGPATRPALGTTRRPAN